MFNMHSYIWYTYINIWQFVYNNFMRKILVSSFAWREKLSVQNAMGFAEWHAHQADCKNAQWQSLYLPSFRDSQGRTQLPLLTSWWSATGSLTPRWGHKERNVTAGKVSRGSEVTRSSWTGHSYERGIDQLLVDNVQFYPSPIIQINKWDSPQLWRNVKKAQPRSIREGLTKSIHLWPITFINCRIRVFTLVVRHLFPRLSAKLLLQSTLT